MQTAAPSFDQALVWINLVPVAFVIIGGILASLAFSQTCPRPASIVLFAMLLLGAATIGQPLAQVWAIQNLKNSDFHRSLTLLTFAFSVVRAVAYGLVITAVFTGRRSVNPNPSPDPAVRIL